MRLLPTFLPTLLLLCLLHLPTQVLARCGPPELEALIRLQPLAPGVWRIAGHEGDTSPANRGVISNLLLVADGARTWLLGSGPSETWGRTLTCHVQHTLQRRITDVIAPWPRPELVLGQAGMPQARRWAHVEVAQAMRERCTSCIERLRQRLGSSAADLGRAEVALPKHLVEGEQGRLGPWRWWHLQRSRTTSVTVWRLERQPIWSAPGLLWADDAPDLRDTDLPQYEQSLRHLITLAAEDGASARWLPEQGDSQPARLPQQHLDYLAALRRAVEAALARGATETDAADPLAGLAGPPRALRHQLDWQRVWRQAEADWLGSGTGDLPR